MDGNSFVSSSSSSISSLSASNRIMRRFNSVLRSLQARRTFDSSALGLRPGRYLISDDEGYVCDAVSLDSRTRCCPLKGERFSCHGCNVLSQCCSSYEFCVSCCLNPTRTLLEIRWLR
ncbi:Uncharacterized protein Rs2_08010 [Raphanus sativus]|nr:Uncharacterized protein Rs2_08010 [Raphanus sativus]